MQVRERPAEDPGLGARESCGALMLVPIPCTSRGASRPAAPHPDHGVRPWALAPTSPVVSASTRSTAASCASVRAVSRSGLFDDERRAAADRREEYAVPSRGVDDRELLLDYDTRLDKSEREEIVGDVCLFEHLRAAASEASPEPTGRSSSHAGQGPADPTKGVLVPLTDHFALVSLTRDVSTRSFLQAAAAVQKQITRDFFPLWGLPATVDVFEDLESVPKRLPPRGAVRRCRRAHGSAGVRNRQGVRGRPDRRFRARSTCRGSTSTRSPASRSHWSRRPTRGA